MEDEWQILEKKYGKDLIGNIREYLDTVKCYHYRVKCAPTLHDTLALIKEENIVLEKIDSRISIELPNIAVYPEIRKLFIDGLRPYQIGSFRGFPITDADRIKNAQTLRSNVTENDRKILAEFEAYMRKTYGGKI